MTSANEKYVALTTYRKNGESSSTPVWIADLGDGTIGFMTPGSSLKARRIRNDPRVLLQSSDARGGLPTAPSRCREPPSSWSAPTLNEYGLPSRRNHRWQATMFMGVAKILKLVGRNQVSDTGVVITLDPAET